MPSDPSLLAAIEERNDDDSAPALKKMLLGFTNTMTPDHQEPRIRTVFRDHKTDDSAEDLIEEQGFFTPEEFRNADHHIEGRFELVWAVSRHRVRLWRGSFRSRGPLEGRSRPAN